MFITCVQSIVWGIYIETVAIYMMIYKWLCTRWVGLCGVSIILCMTSLRVAR